MKNIKKNQIVIYVIALMLVTAGYLSYNINKETVEVSSENSDENIGEAEFVSSSEIGQATDENADSNENGNNEKVSNELEETNSENVEKSVENNSNQTDLETSVDTSNDEYFASSKLERNRMYSQTIETYQTILNSSNSSEEQKAIATQEIANINSTQNAIMVCENLISLKGVKNSVLFVNGDNVSVVIDAEELKQDLVAQIQNIVMRELNVEAENIHIMSK